MPSCLPAPLSSARALTGSEGGTYRREVEGTTQDAAEAELEGVVAQARSGGLIRYRVWPARRHPLRGALLLLLCAGLTSAVAIKAGLFWAGFVLMGAVLGAGLFFFPTEVSLDSYTLHVRAFGTPRTWDLRHFRRFEVSGAPLPRIELIKRSGFDLLKNMSFPVPASHEDILEHLRVWVGRTPTGSFEHDDDLVPEDSL